MFSIRQRIEVVIVHQLVADGDQVPQLLHTIWTQTVGVLGRRYLVTYCQEKLTEGECIHWDSILGYMTIIIKIDAFTLSCRPTFFPEGASNCVSSRCSRSLVARITSSKSFLYWLYEEEDENPLPMMLSCGSDLFVFCRWPLSRSNDSATEVTWAMTPQGASCLLIRSGTRGTRKPPATGFGNL